MRTWKRALPIASTLLIGACTNDFAILQVRPDVSVSPASIDFGRIENGSIDTAEVEIANQGAEPLTVTSVRLQPASFGYGLDGEVPTVDAPWILSGGESRTVRVVFAPNDNGLFGTALIVDCDDEDEPQTTVTVGGEAFLYVVDDFTQGSQAGGLADLLFVVDNSSSMTDKQQKLADSFETFMTWLVDADIDYRIAVATTDMVNPQHQGRFRGDPKVISPATPDPLGSFQANAMVGATGSSNERGLDAVVAALSPSLLSTTNAGFLRDGARLYVVFVTDEDDASQGPVSDYVDDVVSVKGGDPSRVYFAAIAGPAPSGCYNAGGSAAAGTRYDQVIDQTNGLFGSICEPEFGVTLQGLGFEMAAAAGQFFLSYVPNVETLDVTVDGIAQPTDRWSYVSMTNSIRFEDAYVPAPGAHVKVEYDAQ